MEQNKILMVDLLPLNKPTVRVQDLNISKFENRWPTGINAQNASPGHNTEDNHTTKNTNPNHNNLIQSVSKLCTKKANKHP